MAKAKKTAPVAAPVVEETVTAAPAAEAETTTSLEPVQLTIADLQLLARIVDLASRRGAFQAAELSQVGDSFNKLAGFLAYVESVQKKEGDASVDEAETTAPAEAE
jgi:hypothetical protein